MLIVLHFISIIQTLKSISGITSCPLTVTSSNDTLLPQGNGLLRPEIPPFVPPFWADFLQRAWHQMPENRPTFAEIVNILSAADDGPFNETFVESQSSYMQQVRYLMFAVIFSSIIFECTYIFE